MRIQSQGDQDLCAAAVAEDLIFKTSTEEKTVELTNKDMTKDSQRFSRWFHSAWKPSQIYFHASQYVIHQGFVSPPSKWGGVGATRGGDSADSPGKFLPGSVSVRRASVHPNVWCAVRELTIDCVCQQVWKVEENLPSMSSTWSSKRMFTAQKKHEQKATTKSLAHIRAVSFTSGIVKN